MNKAILYKKKTGNCSQLQFKFMAVNSIWKRISTQTPKKQHVTKKYFHYNLQKKLYIELKQPHNKVLCKKKHFVKLVNGTQKK